MSRTRTSSFRPSVELLEDRIVPYSVTPYKWANLDVSASFMSDGALIGTASSNLFAKYDAKYATATWQREFARALQTWATVTPLNFHFAGDNGAAQGTLGYVQGDSKFGDIRLGAYASASTWLALAYFPYTSTTKGGDIVLNSTKTWNIGTVTDLYSVLLHEVGHSLGLNHSTVYGSVMGPTVTKVIAGLAADDIAGIQAKYGARRADPYDAAAANNTFSSASALTVDASGAVALRADLTTVADVDYYKVTVPAGSDGTLTVSLDARNLSLLIPKLSIYNSAQQLVGSASAGAAYGSVVSVKLTGLTAGQTYTIAADGATADVFGMSSYRLNARFGGFGTTSASASSSSTSGTFTSGGGTGGAAYALPGGEYEEEHDEDHHHLAGSMAETAGLHGQALSAETGLGPFGFAPVVGVLGSSLPGASIQQNAVLPGSGAGSARLSGLARNSQVSDRAVLALAGTLTQLSGGKSSSVEAAGDDAFWIELGNSESEDADLCEQP